MKKTIKKVIILSTIFAFTACVPTQRAKPISQNRPIRENSHAISAKYGYPPIDYVNKIKSYFFSRIKRADFAHYIFSKPQKAYKREPLAYGGKIDWRGWMVDVAIETESRTGRKQKPKPYMILFKDSIIIEAILGSKHKLITRVQE